MEAEKKQGVRILFIEEEADAEWWRGMSTYDVPELSPCVRFEGGVAGEEVLAVAFGEGEGGAGEVDGGLVGHLGLLLVAPVSVGGMGCVYVDGYDGFIFLVVVWDRDHSTCC